MKLWTAATIVIILAVAYMLTGCVSKKTYQQNLGLVAILAYTAGINDCGNDVTVTADNVKKRLDSILNSNKGDRP